MSTGSCIAVQQRLKRLLCFVEMMEEEKMKDRRLCISWSISIASDGDCTLQINYNNLQLSVCITIKMRDHVSG